MYDIMQRVLQVHLGILLEITDVAAHLRASRR